MKKRFLLFFVLLPCLLFSYEIMPVDSVKAGMKGYGISVFGGNKLDTFDVEILGVLDQVGPGRKLIIARLSGAGLEKTGIISGMSGSPIFINGKIIGAAAYGWTFSVEPITGITPIDEIISIKVSGDEDFRGDSDIKIREEGKMSPYYGVTLTHIRTPLVVSGFDDWLMKDIDDFFTEKGFSIVLGGGAAGKSGEEDSLFVGSSIGAQLVGGDVSLGAIGTVTYIDGEDVFAFGHPLFFSGEISIPMTTSYVYAVMPSQLSSFKIANIEKEIGTVLQDRRAAIYGKIGKMANTIPLNVTVSKKKETRIFHFDIVDHEELTPFFSGLVVSNSILTQGRGYGSLTLSLEMDIRLDKYGTLSVKNFFSGENALTSSLNNINDVIDLILNDRFEKIKIEELSIKVRVTEEEKTAIIEIVKPGSYTVKKGSEVKVTAFLKGKNGEDIVEKFTLKIPETYSDSIVKIAVVGADGLMKLEMERGADRFITERPGQIIEILKTFPRNNVLYCLLLTSNMGMIIKGYELGSLPSSLLHLMEDSQGLGEGRFIKGGIVRRMERECDYLVTGSSVLTLKIVN
ncbi:hypothetical protein KAU34_00120 [candidate division WOR-3 bacterium]|nr:hypothetical protein [candidate division WOR-3 bacterium]